MIFLWSEKSNTGTGHRPIKKRQVFLVRFLSVPGLSQAPFGQIVHFLKEMKTQLYITGRKTLFKDQKMPKMSV